MRDSETSCYGIKWASGLRAQHHLDEGEPMSGEDCLPFERKECDWGLFKGRLVALDYSTPAWVHDEDE